MRFFKGFWFWFGLIICPVIIIVSVFNAGRIMGLLIYSEQPFTQSLTSHVGIELVITLSLAICAISEFLRSIRHGKAKLSGTASLNLD
ncbi:hypothetical protein L2747_11800 [Shewanella marinintestina]|uniref:hypothetical protein n=1 Tax=Shewanella marinintestina TaxID=190305 RepID=UPI00200BB750|nr:hypothetical protein [Shewanella marinintestina]MCL1146682.1 hypothetical protein [Shewanella marinintestina]